MTKRSNPRYDNPELMPPEFLLEVMRDRSLPLSTRMDAARAHLQQELDAGTLYIDREPWPGEKTIVIRIGGLGTNPPEVIATEPEPTTKIH